MAIQQRTQPSIYLTFKVVQFVNHLRRRLRLRVRASAYPSLLGTDNTLGLESKPLQSIAKGLSRVSPQGSKHLHQASHRVCKNTRHSGNTRSSLKLQASAQGDPANPNTLGGEVQRTLRSVDGRLSPAACALSAVAAKDSLFLKQNNHTSFEPCSLNETIQLLVVTHEAIHTLFACRSRYDDAWLVAQGHEAGLEIDDAFIANYEHLLLQLRGQLIAALAQKVLEALLEGRHDKQQRRLLNWFSEFSDKPRPLSTFPWTIKPSLAVLWGVCWMFYNRPGGSNRVPQVSLLQQVDLGLWSATAPGTAQYHAFGLELTGAQSQPSQPATHQLLPGNGQSMGLGDVSSQYPDLSGDMSRAAPPAAPPHHTSTTYYPADVPSGFQTSHRELNSLPGNSGIITPLVVLPQQHFNHHSIGQPWPHFPPSSTPSLPLPTARPVTTPETPRLELNGVADSQAFAQPQDFASLNNAFSGASPEPQATLNHLNTDFDCPNFSNMAANLAETSPIHNLPGPRHERTASINSNSNIPTPVSMSGPRSPLLSPVGDRKIERRQSVSSSHGHVRHRSEDVSSQDGDEAGSPRRNHAYKRAEEPPRNTDNKMVCKHSECNEITFDRKCEWSKHMDKHDRPYKCNVKGCEKLQGFTYSGGLLRHEREVHKMHGGTKKSLFCPFTDCKRSSGAGFTRKENLAEHVRRVHRRTSMSADMGHLIIPRRESTDDLRTMRRSSESPYQRIIEVPEDDEQLGMKRKRMSDAGASVSGDEELRSEVKRLRQENEEKDSRLRQLEMAVATLQRNNNR